VFFALMVVGLARALPETLSTGLSAQGVPHDIAALPPVSTLFAAFPGSNPIAHLLGGAVLGALPPANVATLTGHQFFPDLVAEPFHDGLVVVFGAATAMTLLAVAVSAARGRHVRQL
jgi:hypothetical protein